MRATDPVATVVWVMVVAFLLTVIVFAPSKVPDERRSQDRVTEVGTTTGAHESPITTQRR